ncbi:MAG: hypothetical protein U0V87_12820 [Acidobacteriota bacterium]
MNRWCRVPVAVLVLGAASVLAQDASVPSSSEWGRLPEELLGVLESKATAYRQRATGFVCTEKIRDAEYEGREASNEKVREYDYSLTKDPSVPEGVRAVRVKPGAGPDAKEVDAKLPFPEPYLWFQVFEPAARSTFRFQVGEWHTTPYKLAIPITWLSSAPVLDGRKVTEWSGLAEVEWRTGNLVRIVARPSLQDERLIAQMQRYLTAFRFLGMSTAPPPLGQELTVSFGYDRDGFSYPQRVELATFQQTGRETRAVVSRQVVEYSDYKFFTTETTYEVPPLTYSPPDPGAAGETRER